MNYIEPPDEARELATQLEQVMKQAGFERWVLCGVADRKLVTELREKLSAIAAPAVSGVLARMAQRTESEVIEAMRKNLAVLDRVKSERDALRAMMERCREVVTEFVVDNPKFRSRHNGEMQDPMGAHELLADLVRASASESSGGGGGFSSENPSTAEKGHNEPSSETAD